MRNLATATAARHDTEVHIVGWGSCTAVGLTPLSIAAAVQAGISQFEEHDYLLGANGQPIVVAQVPCLARSGASIDRMQQLAARAAREALIALAGKLPGKIPVIVGVPAARPGLPAHHIDELRNRLGKLLTSFAADSSLTTVAGGHASGLIALAQGCAALRDGAEFCLIGGVDSYLGCTDPAVSRPAGLIDGALNPAAVDPETLELLSAAGKLHSVETPWGFIPGEGAGFCLLASAQAVDRHELQPLAQILSVAVTREEKLANTDEVCLGEGLSAAFHQVLRQLPPEEGQVDRMFCDLNGDAYRADELGFTLTRTAAHFAQPQAFSAPATCWGDVGAASGPLCINLAIASCASGFHGPVALCYSGSETGERAATVISCAGSISDHLLVTNVSADASAHAEQVVRQHAEDAAFLFQTRGNLLHAPHIALRDLHRYDARLAAHLQGLRAAGDRGRQICESLLESPDNGTVSVALMLATEERNQLEIGRLLALAESVPSLRPGAISVFGWIAAQCLRGTVKDLLSSASPFRRLVGIASCSLHRVDPGAYLSAAIDDDDSALRACALRAAGELGRQDLLPSCERCLQDQDPACRFNAAWAAVLLGNQGTGLDVLLSFLTAEQPFAREAMSLALKVISPAEASEVLKSLAAGPDGQRVLIRGVGVIGDPYYVPWLIAQMQTPQLSRLAGESMSLITGLDLTSLELARAQPEGFQSGPNDDPDDETVAVDEDDNLPWPDPERLEVWWHRNASRFQPGTRHFMGQLISVGHCGNVLFEGFQRQRIAAALHLALLQPGTALFECRAPAWRQQQLS